MKRTVHFVPHTHYDAEVFLTRDETFEIGYSVALGALAAMREDPEFTFVLDQTCYIEPFLRAHPEERTFVEQMIREGRLEITCGMHAMPDVNIPSGESFIRQVLNGKGWMRRELGVDPRTGWLLDTFGQHPQIPQLMVGCGFDNNSFQRLGDVAGPTETWWKGLDGTRLFSHWMRASYCVLFPAPSNLHEFESFVDVRMPELLRNATTPHLLAVSGADLTPVQPHIHRLFKEYNAKHRDNPDKPDYIVSTPKRYFDAIRGYEFPEETGDRNPVFQGCYSARIRIKQWNRKMETVLADAEWADAAVHAEGGESRAARIAEAWEPVLFNQFHDIICGSQVDKVTTNVLNRYERAHELAAPVGDAALEAIAARVDTRGEGIPVVVFNALGWERDDVVEVRFGYSTTDVFEVEVRDDSGRTMSSDLTACERHANGAIKRATVCFIARGVPSSGYATFRIVPATGSAPATTLRSNQPRFLMNDNFVDVIENDRVRLVVDAWNGAIRSLVHKATGWEVIDPDRPYGGTIVRELDNGNFWEYNGHCKGDALTPTLRLHPLPAEGDARAAFSHHYGGDGRVVNGKARTDYVVHFAYGSGYFATRIRVYDGLPRVDIHTTLVNEEERVRYRMALPTTIAEGTMTQEIPFGAIDRPEGEFPAQHWMDWSDGGRGVAVLNRGLPGNSVEGGVAMLALLKCTALKEGYGEIGGFSKSTKTTDGYEKGVRHEFDYAVLPHGGDWREADLVRRGAEFNRPLRAIKPAVHAGELPARRSFWSVSSEHVVLSAVRVDDDGAVVVRVYEAHGSNAAGVAIRSAWDIVSAESVDLVEQGGTPVAVGADGRSVTIDVAAFGIRTVRLRLRGASAG
ncbi:MAG: alpha-mannosidase [Armatimonadota bacterium]